MDSISDIKIISIDKLRPPRMRKEAYIDIYYQLSHQAPADWCEDFNIIGKRLDPSVKIKPAEGLYIEAWVRNMDQIKAQLELVKNKIVMCNEAYIEKMRQKELLAAQNSEKFSGVDSAQKKLNAIVASLQYS